MQPTNEFLAGRIKITKLEAARRQLETAITLYFNGGDPASTHTLASAALEILSDLNSACNGSPMLTDLEASTAISPDKIKFAREVLRGPQNFFKHADKDPKGVIDFHPEVPVGFILAGIEKYRELSAENPPLMRVFSLWIRIQWTDVFRFSKNEDAIFKTVRSFFDSGDKTKFFEHVFPLYERQARK